MPKRDGSDACLSACPVAAVPLVMMRMYWSSVPNLFHFVRSSAVAAASISSSSVTGCVASDVVSSDGER